MATTPMLKYHNDLNEITLTSLTGLQINIFFAICQLIAKSEDNKIEFSLQDIRQMSTSRYESNEEFYTILENTLRKIGAVTMGEVGKGEFTIMALITKADVSDSKDYLKLSINYEAIPLFKEVLENFTLIDLHTLNSLVSRYSKEVYRRMMQFRIKGKWYISLEDFRRLLDIPKDYTMKKITGDILNRCIMKELPQHFPNLKINKIKKGRSVIALQFLWDASNVIDISNNTPVADCPICGHSLYEIPTKDGGSFLGHRKSDRKKFNCNRTFDSLEDVDAERYRMEKKAINQQYQIEQEHSKTNQRTIQEIAVKNDMERLVKENAELFEKPPTRFEDELAIFQCKKEYEPDQPFYKLFYTNEDYDILKNKIQKLKSK